MLNYVPNKLLQTDAQTYTLLPLLQLYQASATWSIWKASVITIAYDMHNFEMWGKQLISNKAWIWMLTQPWYHRMEYCFGNCRVCDLEMKLKHWGIMSTHMTMFKELWNIFYVSMGHRISWMNWNNKLPVMNMRWLIWDPECYIHVYFQSPQFPLIRSHCWNIECNCLCYPYHW